MHLDDDARLEWALFRYRLIAEVVEAPASALFQHSRGVPRLIQGLALGALMAAASGSKKTVDADSVQQALLDMEAA